MGFPFVLVVTCVVLFGPGLVILRMYGVRGLVALAVSPALTAAVVALGAALADVAGFRWNLLTLCVATVVPVLLLAGITVGRRSPRPCVPAPPPWSSRVVSGAVALVCALLLVGPKLFGVDLSRPAQAVDSTFHQNAVWLTARTGNASYFGSLSCMYGVECPPTRYPNALHGIVAPVAQVSGAVVATNALTVVIPMIWVLGMMALARASAPRLPLAVPVAGVLTTFVHAFPMGLVDELPLWPNALAVAMLPGVCALTVLTCAVVRCRVRRGWWVLTGVTVAAAFGVCAVHPTAFFSLVVMVLPGVVVSAAWSWGQVSRYRGAGWTGLVFALVTVVAAVPVVLALRSPATQQMLSRPVLGDMRWPGLKLSYLFTLWLHWPSQIGTSLVVLVLAVLAVVGALAAARFRHMWWLLGAWMATGLLLESSMFPIPFVSHLTGLWYSSPERLLPLHVIPVVTVAAVGGADVLERIRRRVGATLPDAWMLVPLVLTLSLSTTVLGPYRLAAARELYRPEPGSLTHLADADELALIRSARSLVGPDAYVLGDPANGSALLQAYGDVRVVFPHITLPEGSTDSMYLVQRFRDLDSDPEVCRIVNEYGITHFYADQDGLYADVDMAARTPGLYHVDTSHGFSLVAHGGTASLWRIDACASP